MNAKLFVSLLVVLVVLFAVSLGLNLVQDDDRPPSGWQEDLLAAFGTGIPKRAAGPDDVRRAIPAECWQAAQAQVRIAAGSACRLFLSPANTPRGLTLALLTGVSAELALTQPVNRDGDEVTTRETLNRGQQVVLDIYRQQSQDDRVSLDMACLGAGGETCALEVRE